MSDVLLFVVMPRPVTLLCLPTACVQFRLRVRPPHLVPHTWTGIFFSPAQTTLGTLTARSLDIVSLLALPNRFLAQKLGVYRTVIMLVRLSLICQILDAGARFFFPSSFTLSLSGGTTCHLHAAAEGERWLGQVGRDTREDCFLTFLFYSGHLGGSTVNRIVSVTLGCCVPALHIILSNLPSQRS